jgi:hypothetical protein
VDQVALRFDLLAQRARWMRDFSLTLRRLMLRSATVLPQRGQGHLPLHSTDDRFPLISAKKHPHFLIFFQRRFSIMRG